MVSGVLRFRPTQLTLLALVAIATGVGAVVLALSIYLSLERQIERPTENWQWAVYQLQAEHLKLMAAAREAETGATRFDSLEERYEIFVSRILTILEGGAYVDLRESPYLKDLLLRLQAALETIDDALESSELSLSGFSRLIFDNLGGLAEPLQKAALDVVSYTGGLRAAERDMMHDEMLYLMTCLGVLFAVSAVLGGVTIRQIAALRGSGQRLSEALALAERSSQAKSRFVASMSHEMRTPLNAVYGMLREIGHLSTDPRIDRMLSMAQSSAGMLCGLVDDVIDAARVESGKFQVKLSSFELEALLREAIDLLKERAHDHGNTISLDTGDIGPRIIEADRARIKQVLVNLIGNAAKFTRDGSIAVVARIAYVGRGQVRLRVSVSDTGVGIAPDQQEQIFQRFYQGGHLDGEGIGLGLSISRDIVERLGGRLAMTSELGRGSVFWFEIPVASGVAEPKMHSPLPVAAPPPLAGLHVLVAEDNGINRQVIHFLLQRLGATCVFAVDGREAVRVAPSEPFDLILMDINMPEMDGMTAFREIGREMGDARPPVLALTASAMPEDIQSFRDAGMAGCVTKPIDENALVGKICEILNLDAMDPPPAQPAAAAASAGQPLSQRQKSALLSMVAQLDDD